MGTDPTNALTLVSENPFAVGDFDGDGIDDVAVIHLVNINFPATPVLVRSFVTVLDGETGKTLWWRKYAALVSHLVAADVNGAGGQELVVAIEREYENSTLEAIGFQGSPLSATALWTFKPGPIAAAFIHVDRMSGVEGIAVSWSSQGQTDLGPKGHLVMLDPGSGAVRWQKESDGYVRTFREDPLTGELTLQEIDADPPGVDQARESYMIRSVSIADGSQVGEVLREDALMLRMELGDVDGDGAAEVAVTEIVFHTGTTRVASARISVLERDGTVRWRYELPVSQTGLDGEDLLPTPHGLAIVPGERPVVLVASTSQWYDAVRAETGTSDSLLAFAGDATGDAEPLWRDDNDRAWRTPLFLDVIEGSTAIVGTMGLGAEAYDATTGTLLSRLPILADPYAVEAHDVNADGTRDLLVAGGSGVLFALDGKGLGSDPPEVLWAAPVEGSIRDLEIGDLTGDGAPEAVVAATGQVVAISLRDGSVLWSHRGAAERPPDFLWSVTVGDMTGDGRADVAVPGEQLVALDGPTGDVLWTFEPDGGGDPSHFSEVALLDADGDGILDAGAQYAWKLPMVAARHILGRVAIEGETGDPLWHEEHKEPNAIPQLFRGVVGYATDAGPRLALGYLDGAPDEDIVDWNPKVDVLDPGTGEQIWSSDKLQGSGPFIEALLHSPAGGDELFEFDWEAGWRSTPTGSTRPMLLHDNISIFDATFARLGEDRQPYLATAQTGLKPFRIALYSPGTVWGEEVVDPQPVATWQDGGVLGPRVLGGRQVSSVDLDGRGTDEIVGLDLDAEAYSTVHRFEGILVNVTDLSRHGIVVLEAVGA